LMRSATPCYVFSRTWLLFVGKKLKSRANPRGQSPADPCWASLRQEGQRSLQSSHCASRLQAAALHGERASHLCSCSV
ncbi:hypothetical protein NDU88_008205, partial [Pleurodeles waltl]